MNPRPTLHRRRPRPERQPSQSTTTASAPSRPGEADGLRLERILVPTDFSDLAADALRFAVPFARETGARLDLLHVVPPFSLPPEASPRPGEWRRVEERQRRGAGVRLRRLAAAEVRPPMRAGTLVQAGEPAGVIVSAAGRLRSDLVVISTHGHTGLKRFLLGSTVEAVVRRAPCPVLTVRRRVLARGGTPQTPPSDRINRILVAVDFTASSQRMLEYAAAFARRFTASLLLLHVVDHISVPTRLAYMASRLQLVVLERGLSHLAGLVRRLVPGDLKAEQLVCAGAPYDVILRTARRQRVDLILIATRGPAGFRQFFLGSTAGRVVRHAPCPVLVVR